MNVIRVLSLAFAVVTAGCTQPAADNLLFISFDTTRADHLGAYGYDLDTSPNIDGLASRGVVFERAYSHVPSTLPSHSSMFTGLLPPGHGVRCNGRFVLPEERLTLAEILNDQGFDTAAILGAFPLENRFGLNQGFEVYDDQFGKSSLKRSNPESWLGLEVESFRRSAQEVTDRALEWLEDREGQWFLFVHYFDPHTPYRYQGGLSDLPPYDAEIHYADSNLGRILDAVEMMPGRTLIVFTADHGEGLGDHGEETHSRLVYNSTIRVPLMMVLDNTIQPGTRIDANVGHIDLLPTILELFGIRAPEGLPGSSLNALMNGEVPLAPRVHYAESLVGVLEGGDPRERRTLISGNNKLILTEDGRTQAKRELFDLANDPGESMNLFEEQVQLLDQLDNELQDLSWQLEKSAARPLTIELDDEALEKLRGLGYVQ